MILRRECLTTRPLVPSIKSLFPNARRTFDLTVKHCASEVGTRVTFYNLFLVNLKLDMPVADILGKLHSKAFLFCTATILEFEEIWMVAEIIEESKFPDVANYLVETITHPLS